MPGLDPVSLGLGLATALPKIGLGIKQLNDANSLKFQDTTTPEQREMLGIARQRAAFGRLPGLGLAQARLAQAQNTTLQNATLGAGSATELLAAGAAADRTRQNGELQLGLQGEQYNQRAQDGLTQQLGLQAQQRQRDLAAYNGQKAALTQGGYTNISNGIDSGAAYTAYGLFGKGTADAGATSPGIRGLGLPGYSPGLSGGRYRNSSLRYGIPSSDY